MHRNTYVCKGTFYSLQDAAAILCISKEALIELLDVGEIEFFIDHCYSGIYTRVDAKSLMEYKEKMINKIVKFNDSEEKINWKKELIFAGIGLAIVGFSFLWR